jgi:hypothetical protein
MKRTYLDTVHNGIYYLNVWAYTHSDFKWLVDAVEKKDISTIRLLGAEEYVFMPFYHDSETFRIFKGFCNYHNITLEIITGCNLSYKLNYRYPIIDHRDSFISWETFFAFQTVENALSHSRLPLGHSKDINKHFVSLNGRAHPHRCLFLDHMFNANLFQHGYISFRNSDNWDYGYEFKYWKPEILKFDDLHENRPDGYVDYMLPPLEFKDALFSVICESTVDVQFITEKTYIPIWNRRPFLVYGHPRANEYIKSLGFKLFDNIIDYSFDSIEDDETRCIEFMKQVKQICNRDISMLRKKVEQTVHYNWLWLLKIVGDQETRRKILKKLDPNTNHVQVDVYRKMLNITDNPDYISVIDGLKEQYENIINRK